ncbi:unnamed protein product [Rotaria magnacalcarata]|uniref:Protein-lysine N-methyltransferase BYL167_LOCUS4322 n=1 Tax=Rotaria magnacalcarata TaxID=392030 RepID=A0A816L948_9BILA|nr:unnamed protein product [Rotaria magnacalcarata]CAF1668273.1 unnamed protein product [Rotaria magnacalcarata]CAF1930829.1 unnamed protein product [Rotaria magnacalcarata]CAF1948764.1 unnamed protein product [Rotaria magnacalcarata]CAF2104050.1 unnamed protein product [Rotaria magnacalcarata]
MNIDDDDDGPPQLSAETLKALQEWQQEQENNKTNNVPGEDWQLSQFWYNNETATRLMNEVIAILPQNGKCACIACPTVWSLMRKEHPEMDNILFEYDTRFSTDSNSFIEYDYNDDDRIEQNYFSLKHTFDVLIIDPPFLSRECFEKVSRLVKFIGKTTPQCKHIICTGAIQEENIKDFFPGAYRVLFQPQHERNLMNPFACFVDYETKTLNTE